MNGANCSIAIGFGASAGLSIQQAQSPGGTGKLNRTWWHSVAGASMPTWAVPQSYQLAFKVDPAQQDFSGTTTIKLKLTKASDHVWLDGNELKISSVTITDAAGKTHTGTYTAVEPKAGVARVDFGSTPKPLGHALFVFDASDNNNIAPRMRINLQFPGGTGRWEAWTFGPFLILRTLDPTRTVETYLQRARDAQLVGKRLYLGDADVNYDTVWRAQLRLKRSRQ